MLDAVAGLRACAGVQPSLGFDRPSLSFEPFEHELLMAVRAEHRIRGCHELHVLGTLHGDRARQIEPLSSVERGKNHHAHPVWRPVIVPAPQRMLDDGSCGVRDIVQAPYVDRVVERPYVVRIKCLATPVGAAVPEQGGKGTND